MKGGAALPAFRRCVDACICSLLMICALFVLTFDQWGRGGVIVKLGKGEGGTT